LEPPTKPFDFDEPGRRVEFYLTESQRLSQVGSWAWSAKTREPIFWSREMFRIFGFDPDDPALTLQAIHRLSKSRVHPEDWPAVEATILRAAVDKRDFAMEYRILLPNGELRYARGIGHPVVDDSGQLLELTGTVLDVTERKRAEDERQKSLDQFRALAGRLESVREEERKRLAREIHDELGQALTSIKLDVCHLRKQAPEEHLDRYQAILKTIDQTIHDVRRISTELRPGILDDLGLVAAVEWAAEEFTNRTGTRCAVSLSPCTPEIDPARATAIFRILQETLTNVARHADATEVDVRLSKSSCGLILEVQDNGIGFDERRLCGAGSLGILGMKERALLLGGEFAIRTAPGAGTKVTVRIPFGD